MVHCKSDLSTFTLHLEYSPISVYHSPIHSLCSIFSDKVFQAMPYFHNCSYFYHSLFLRDSCIYVNFSYLQSWAQILSLFCIFNSNPYFLPRPRTKFHDGRDLVFSSLYNLEECLIPVIEVINYAHSMDSRHPIILNTNRTTLDFFSKLSPIIVNCIH